MKIGIVGCGFVGSTAAYALLMEGIGREIVLVDRNQERCEAEATDLRHAIPFAHPLRVRAGEYADLADCRVVLLCAGVNQKPGESRLELLTRNAAVFADVVPQVVKHAGDAVLVVATNPVDVMTHVTAQLCQQFGGDPRRVLGSGTTLDTARFRSLLGEYIGVDPHHVHGYVVGEHGDSEVLAWSLVTVGSMTLAEFIAERDLSFDDTWRQNIDRQVRGAAYNIIRGKGATYYGIGAALARITDTILHDRRSILTVCAPAAEVAGVRDVTLSLPRLVGGVGVLDTFPLSLATEEHSQLQRSASVVRGALAALRLA